MKNTYDLSSTEIEIMEFFWKESRGVTFKEVMDYVNGELGKDWKKQTLGTYLKNLQVAGVITADSSQKKYVYRSTHTREEYVHKWTKNLVEESFGNSISKFMVAFAGGKKLDDSDRDELRKLL